MRSLYDGEVFDRAKSAGSGYPSARGPIDIRKRALGAAALPDRRTVASHLWLSLGAQGLTAPSRGVFDYELANKEARREDSLLQTELRNTLKTPRSPLYCAPDLRLRSPAVRYENRHNLERCRCPATAYLERANTNSCPSDLLIDSDSMQSSRRDRLWHSAGPEGEISASKDDLNPWHHEVSSPSDPSQGPLLWLCANLNAGPSSCGSRFRAALDMARSQSWQNDDSASRSE